MANLPILLAAAISALLIVFGIVLRGLLAEVAQMRKDTSWLVEDRKARATGREAELRHPAGALGGFTQGVDEDQSSTMDLPADIAQTIALFRHH